MSTDRDALLALFRSTDGANWARKGNWGIDERLWMWYGLEVSSSSLDGLQEPLSASAVSLIRLRELRLVDNQLSGAIPPELGNLAALTHLELQGNRLSGHIPKKLGALSKLRRLWLWGNQLAGPIPPELGNLAALEFLNLARNQLSGSIPPELGNLRALQHFHLEGNQLTGPIPPELGDLVALGYLHLERNNLCGFIPKELGALSELKELSVFSNQLTGPIPELGNLAALKYLHLAGNQLNGTVPLSVWKLPCTRRVDVSGNLLTRFTDPDDKSASASAVLGCMERLESLKGYGGLHTAGNPWEFPPAAVAVKERKFVRKFYASWEQCDFSLEEVHALKLVFVGAYGAGKTSLARSMKMRRGNRTPETEENRRTTVGIDIHTHHLRNGTECKLYDVAGQITYYGLHQFFLTERAIYLIVWDATKFEGLRGERLDHVIEDNILEWVSLLHMRTPLCTVMLVASHCDLLRGAPRENDQLLKAVEMRFKELHKDWMSLRQRQSSSMDARMVILPGVFPVACKLETESASYTAEDGLQAVEEALSKQASVVSLVPPSWVAARKMLEQVGSTDDGDGRRRPWELRSVLHAAFRDLVEESRRKGSRGSQHQYLASCSRLQDGGIRDSMEGAIELRAFSGTVISHDIFVVLDVMWLAGVLRPILDHRGITKSRTGQKMFANRVLNSTNLLYWASELVGKGILRKGFARFLWNLDGEGTEKSDDQYNMEPAKFEEILKEIGVATPLPVTHVETSAEESGTKNVPVARETTAPGDGAVDGTDLLVVMRLPLEVDAETRQTLSSVRQSALMPGDGSGGTAKLRAVVEFDHAGAPHGLPERVMALSHKIGTFSPRARWRHGGLFVLHNDGDSSGASSMILEYDKKLKTFSIEALGHTAPYFRAVQFVISALFHVASDFPGTNWTGWMECEMNHDGEKMYHLAPSEEKESQKPGSWIIPRTKSSPWEQGSKQQNLCSMQGVEPRGSCTVDPDVYGRVLDVKQPYRSQDVGETADVHDPSPHFQCNEHGRETEDVDHPPSRCREAHEYVFKPLSGKIASSSLVFSVGFLVAATAIDDAKGVTLVNVCFGLAGLCFLFAVVAALVFGMDKIAEGRKRSQERAERADEHAVPFSP